MAIRFRCGRCQQVLSIASRRAGANVPCPRCGATLRVPEAGPETSSKSAPQPADAPHSSLADSLATGAHLEVENAYDEEPLRIKRRRVGGDEMDLTPMVDMTFLLLIFFMVTASFSQQKTLQVPPPDQDKKGATQTVEQLEDIQRDSVRIEVDAANRIAVEDDKLADVSLLADVIREKMRTDLKTEAMVTIDPRALHETAVRVVDACNEAGIQKIRLVGRAVVGGGE